MHWISLIMRPFCDHERITPSYRIPRDELRNSPRVLLLSKPEHTPLPTTLPTLTRPANAAHINICQSLAHRIASQQLLTFEMSSRYASHLWILLGWIDVLTKWLNLSPGKSQMCSGRRSSRLSNARQRKKSAMVLWAMLKCHPLFLWKVELLISISLFRLQMTS